MNILLLKTWFEDNKRDLPWRINPSAYTVWISEIMLQQTQVAVVIPYYLRWMKLFPSIESLAEAPLSTILKAWEGLGYYSRARNIHEGARYIMDTFQGEFPSSTEELAKIKGVGPYTIGAIQSFAFKKRAVAVDANVMRVLTRHFNITDDITKQRTVQSLRNLVEKFLPLEDPWIVNEALIELGATVCQRKPSCEGCPLTYSCEAFRRGIAEQLPYKSKKMSVTAIYRATAVIWCKGHLLLRKGSPGEIMSDLYEFPFFDTDVDGMESHELTKKISNKWQIDVSLLAELDHVKHSFTRYRATLHPVVFSCNTMIDIPGCEWVAFDEVASLPFSSGHKRVLHAASKIGNRYHRLP